MNSSNMLANIPEAIHMADYLAQKWKEAEATLQISKEKMVGREQEVLLTFEQGEEAWLNRTNIQLQTNSDKLDPKQLGLFKVIEKISSHACCLDLPPPMRIPNVFYVGLLSNIHKSPSQPFLEKPLPKTIKGEEYEVEQVPNSKRRENKWSYLVKWMGYGL
ncbi:Retrotransposable element Tf2 protein [Rhizoctonia solani]|uniref:Retrotransposable element Tf2 protein n=1 Tax=Rhizoctonia solani TaxID=456999 RepID=A0A8H8SW59_9AGAM|nr:Retrotransposable element Tf2 protein [Rhizoctonia solani]QRW19994.1 Retrotransposable element Tf2 protein [Rhizoctonia solani]